MKLNYIVLLITITTLFAISVSALPAFTSGPTFSISGNKMVFSFTLSESCDVDVAVIDQSNDKVIKHLAAGKLSGEFPPPPPLTAGLSQQIEWDGTDDYGNWAGDKSVKLRVRANVRPELNKTIHFSVPTQRYWNKTLIPRNPLYQAQTDTFISLTAYKFSNSYGDYSLYPTTAEMDFSVNDETDEIIVRSSTNPSVIIAKYNGQGKDSVKTTQFTLSSSNKIVWDSTGAYYKPRMNFGEQFYSWDGKYIYHDEMYSYKTLFKYNALNGLAAKFEGDSSEYIDGNNYLMTRGFRGSGQVELPFKGRGFSDDKDGNLYYAVFADTMDQRHWNMSNGTTKIGYIVRKWDKNGNLLNKNLLRTLPCIGGGIKVDIKGNLYVGMIVKPYGQAVPPEIKNQLSTSYSSHYSYADKWYGSLVKFSPAGGTAYYNTTGSYTMGNPTVRIDMKGHEWMYYGYSIQTSFSYAVRSACHCFAPRFDVDRFSKITFPNVFENSYICLDENKNLLFKLHNREFLKDSVKIGTGALVQTTDKGMYIGDGTNNQILCFNWKAEAEQYLTIPTLGATSNTGLLTNKSLTVTASPNPFSETAFISVKTSDSRSVTLSIFSVDGKLINRLKSSSIHGEMRLYNWNGRDSNGALVKNGFYFYKADNGTNCASGRLTFIK
ncbi:MAG: T9SS type A sorting domain-containing protein [Fibrobacteres bacterium]|nr:T9SS type A sorting domain-containing protein [Fibrobacterota bacterium]